MSTLVLQVPVISTAHLPSSDAVDECECLAASYDNGWFVYMDDDEPEDGTVPEWYLAVWRWATPKGYSWVRFDSDGDRIDDLPTFDWEAA